MWKQRAVTLCGCLAILPLVVGCTNGVGGPQPYATPPAYAPYGAPPQAYAPPATYAPSAYVPSASYASSRPYALPATAAPADIRTAPVYAAGPGAPAAILVLLPGPGDFLTANPQLWTAQGFDVVAPPPFEIYQAAANQEQAIAQLIAQAQAVANAPVWLMGPSQAIETAIPQTDGRLSGVIVTSETTPVYSCNESFSYYNPGTGAPPQVKVSRSGDCGLAGLPGSVSGGEPSVVAPAPAPRPHHPRIIEASAAGKNLPPAAQVHRLAQLIKGAPPS